MKKYLLIIVSLCVLSCEDKSDEVNVGGDSGVTEINNFNNSGVNFRIENAGLTRVGVSDMYYLKAEMPNDSLTLEGVINIEIDTAGNRVVSLFRTDDRLPDDIFVGSYTVDESLQIIGVEVGDDVAFAELQMRLPGESNWACIRREYADMKRAYEARVLDDIACDIIAPACKVLALIAAAVECDKKV